MTFLELCQELVRIGGISGNGPVTTSGQTGEYRRVVMFIRQAHEEICNQHFDWDFLWDQVVDTAEEEVVSAPDGLGIWDAERLFLDGEQLNAVDYADYVPETRDPARPHEAVIRPDGALQLVPEPDQAYPIRFDYFKACPALTDDDDVPVIPARFQRAIIGRALMLLGNYEFAEDLMKQGQEMYQQYLASLEAHQLSRRQQTHGRQEAKPITVVAQ
ncbi:MAG: hypothetical protein ACOCPR_06130 [Guyparkeria sp.]